MKQVHAKRKKKKKKKKKKWTNRVKGGGQRVLDFRHAGAQGTYVLMNNWRDPALNRAMDKFIEEADAMRAMSLKQCQQG